MGTTDFAGMKMKLMASITAIVSRECAGGNLRAELFSLNLT
jgi:hypothetical protein